MQNPPSPLDTLRQLKEMLDAGALTPTEFEALKQRLVLGPDVAPPPAAPTAPIAPAPEMPAVPPVAPLPPPPAAVEQHSPMFEDVADDEPFIPAAIRPAPTATNSPIVPPPPAPAAFVPAPEPEPEPLPGWSTDEFPASETAPSRSPLALILSIGGLLALLGLVLYLSLNRPPSEHISSTSQTAADSLANPIETGPQAEQLPTIESVPETVRVAPTNPAPVIQPRPALAAPDSTTKVAPAAASDSTAGQ